MATARRSTLLALSLLLFVLPVRAQHIAGYNYDESKIAPYTLLDPLRLANGHTGPPASLLAGVESPPTHPAQPSNPPPKSLLPSQKPSSHTS